MLSPCILHIGSLHLYNFNATFADRKKIVHSMPHTKTPRESEVIKTEVVCPNDTNPMGILQGGRMIDWMDIAAAIAAQTHSGRICVTVSMQDVRFLQPAQQGDIVTIRARLTRCFTTSMEILTEAFVRNIHQPENQLVAHAFMTFVCKDQSGHLQAIPELMPETTEEKQLFEGAQLRRQQRHNQVLASGR